MRAAAAGPDGPFLQFRTRSHSLAAQCMYLAAPHRIGGRAAPCVRFSCSRTQRVRFGLMHETQKFFFPADGKRSFPLPIFFHGASAAAHLRAAAMGSL